MTSGDRAFGALLKRYRLAAGLTQEALAARAGLSARAVSDLERDPGRLPRLDSVALLADALALADAERRALHAAARTVCTPGDPPAPVAAGGPDPRARPATRYARSGDVSIAYQVDGDGPVDLILAPGAISHVEWMWEEPRVAREFRALAAFSRLIRFDKRGTGLSDRVLGAAMIEERMDDIRAVLDAAGSARAVICGVSFGAALAMLFAATYPERTLGLIVHGGEAAQVRRPDYPWPPSAAAAWAALEASAPTLHEHWGEPVGVAAQVARLGPSLVGDAAFVRWFAGLVRLGSSPGSQLAVSRLNLALDVRGVLPSIRVPTLVLHRTGDRQKDIGEGRYIAAHIPGARFVALPGDDHFSFAGDPAPFLAAVAAFVATVGRPAAPDRVLATALAAAPVLAAGAVAPADAWAAWRALARDEFARYRGARLAVGEATLLGTFDGPIRAVRCAQDVVRGAAALGLRLGAGVHTGECDRREDRARGPAADVAVRLAGAAAPGTVLVSGLVRDLTAGSGLVFTALDPDRGADGPGAGPRYVVG